MEARYITGVLIQILMTGILDTVTGNNLKRWLRRGNLVRSEVAQATKETQAEQNLFVRYYGPKITSCGRAEIQEHVAWRSLRRIKLSHGI